MKLSCSATTLLVKLFPFLLPITCEAASDNHRVVIYYQTTNFNSSADSHISLLPLVESAPIAVTHVLVSALHLDDTDGIHLNDFPPNNTRFDAVWSDVATLQSQGVTVMGMLGGAAAGSFTRLDGDDEQFEKYYGPLKETIGTYNLQGLDLDVEEDMSLSGIVRLIDRLNSDFGDDFVITLAPVASALQEGGGNLSGFSYTDLEAQRGGEIDFYNAQFYSGFGSASSTSDYQDIVDSGFPADKVVLGLLTNSANGNGFVALATSGGVIEDLVTEYPEFGGVAGWEYFNSLPGGTSAPEEWAAWAAEHQAAANTVDTSSAKFKATRAAHDTWHVVRRWSRQTWRWLK
ncbi:glycoside hydrolase superfamily [Truncatella angustata]|uniref:Glycoside hydrolase superfamily n=1 Tax=Truncatella angustata TaxID=152316 RepID=A0A9P8RN54_9PEZI|nr:glycoside hydrolase superfamily [Truncatella angustata]KAH6647263.1 glycoside hydrolase superfamily [Truncatella angustata]